MIVIILADDADRTPLWESSRARHNPASTPSRSAAFRNGSGAGGLVKLSSIGRDGGLIVARVMPLRLHGSIARLPLPGRSEASIERPGGVEG